MPSGQQHVPRLRGYKLVPSVAARVFFDASRKVLVEKSTLSDQDLMNEACPGFCNPFVKYPKPYGECTLATKVVRQQHSYREAHIHWPTPDERVASMYELEKPPEMSFEDWVKYCRAEVGN